MTKRELTIDGVTINDASDCYVIAEIGQNHQGDVATCKQLFDAAKHCGAHAVKLQKRDNPTLYTKAMYESPYNSENAFAPTYGKHREFLEFSKEQYQELQAYAKKIGITFFATAWDMPSADLLAAIDMPAYKHASGDITNIPLLRYVAKIGKPVIISTGGASMQDIRRAVEAIYPINPQLAVLQCTAGYPPAWEELNLRFIETLRKEFPYLVIGFSSHDNGIAMATASYVLGARIVEKHFTLNRAMKGTDHAFSLERTGLEKMVRDLKRVRIALGDGIKQVYPSEEKPIYKMGKKLVAVKDLPAGHVLSEDDLIAKAPNDGLPPYELDQLVGKRLVKALAADEAIRFADVEMAADAKKPKKITEKAA